MFNIERQQIDWGGRPLAIETGLMARQADGAVLVTYGETQVLCTAVARKEVREGADFFPLTVNYQEKMSAAGRIPGGFFKREGRPSEKETLTSRLIDRPIRPLFPAGFRNELQIICTVLSADLENDPDIPAMVGASAALALSGAPFMGPIAGARVGFAEGAYVLNPRIPELADSHLDLVVAGTRDGVLMVESEANELSEETMLGAVMFGHEHMQPVISAIADLAAAAAREPWATEEAEDHSAVQAFVAEAGGDGLRAAYQVQEKQQRVEQVAAVRADVGERAGEEHDATAVGDALKKLEKDIVRSAILETGTRIDGRDVQTVRPIECRAGLLTRTHGSALFTRGETQALVSVTLGTTPDEQVVESLDGVARERFMLHYNFPPYSVGETGRMFGPGRREIGHGKLAWRALRPLLPDAEAFPYTIRVISEITESNGSSSMATVCGSSLAMMDAGVPVARPVAGIAMGLIKEGDQFAVLSDILGDEDHLGDMDFKVAGTRDGITSLQMDIKITGITEEIMQTALNQARDGRFHILDAMEGALSSARSQMSAHAPKIVGIKIPVDRIREIIGPGGKIIREICATSGATVDVNDDGSVQIASSSQESIDLALKEINSIVAEPEIGGIYDGTVVKVVDFGAFVNFFGKRDGLVHISELVPRRVRSVQDVVQEGDEVKVKVIEVDDRGRVRLSMKAVDQASGEDLANRAKPAPEPARRMRPPAWE
ncbi:MAG: polyribonucleotide nucleotidyltransferase [Rhodospirillales bacterium]|nr:polyribonucleotide nucleotidyltransferase [Rhodospirillales bacterium]MDE0711964.1 polyribonucleotide nucleotidyltransferase [Rhodospirillales bacterium]